MCIYIKNPLNFRVRYDLMTNETKAIIVEFTKSNTKSFAVAVAYRAPDGNPDIFLDYMSCAIKVLNHE